MTRPRGGVSDGPPGVPRWLRVAALVIAIVVLGLVAAMVAGRLMASPVDRAGHPVAVPELVGRPDLPAC